MIQKSFSIITSQKIKKFNKRITVDGDKSISQRLLLIGAISEGITKIDNMLESKDIFSAIECLKKLGIKIRKKEGKYLVYGMGLGSLNIKKNTTLNFGNSGTLARLMIGILSTTPNISVKLQGDKSLNKRNMGELIKQMEKFGADFFPKTKYKFPLKLNSSNLPVGLEYVSGKSAQIKSAVMLAGLNSFGNTTIVEKFKSRNHTENILLNSPKCIKVKKGKENLITIYGKKKLNSLQSEIPGDPSSAAFYVSLCLLSNNSKLLIKNVQLNPTRIGFYKILKEHGAKIFFKNLKKKNHEYVGDILVFSSKIKNLNVDKKFYVNSTDEYPIMFVIAALTSGVSIFKGIQGLKNKESDRIIEMQKVLSQIGIKSIFNKDQLKIYGISKLEGLKKSISVSSILDHRICMSTLILSLLTGIKSKINNFETVSTSSPNFLKIIKSLGGKYEIK